MRVFAAHKNNRRHGVAYVFALMLLAIMTSLAIGMGSGFNLILQRPENTQLALSAQLAAESGVAYLRYQISQPMVQPTTTGSSLMTVLYNHLTTQLNASSSIASGSVTLDSITNVITVPTITIDSQQSFSAEISLISAREVRLKVTGYKSYGEGSITRICSIDLEPYAITGTIFQNGIVTNGKFIMSGGGEITGMHNNAEANILCAGSIIDEVDPLVNLSGSCAVYGDIYVQDPSQSIEVKGNIRIGDEYYASQTITQEDIAENPDAYSSVLIGTEPVVFPSMDPTVFEPFVAGGDVIDDISDVDTKTTWTNVRIKAGVNPHFSGQISFYGVIYIEQPNNVKFSGDISITGVIVTEEGNSINPSSIEFTGGETLLE